MDRKELINKLKLLYEELVEASEEVFGLLEELMTPEEYEVKIDVSIGGIAKAGDIKKLGLIAASEKFARENDREFNALKNLIDDELFGGC